MSFNGRFFIQCEKSTLYLEKTEKKQQNCRVKIKNFTPLQNLFKKAKGNPKNEALNVLSMILNK